MHVETDGIAKCFGGIVALSDVALELPSKTVTAIIGPNGAGKTTLFNVIAGFVQPDRGSVLLVDEEFGMTTNIVGLSPCQIARKGVGVLFQDVRVFSGLSAIDNVAVAVKNQAGEHPLKCFLRAGDVRRQNASALATARHYLDYVGISNASGLWTEQLSYGQQKLVAIARLLAGDARVLLLDEPTAGVPRDMVNRLLSLIQKLANNDGRAIVMIEHNLNVVRSVGDWVYLMAGGRIEVFGKPKEVLRDSSLQRMFPTL